MSCCSQPQGGCILTPVINGQRVILRLYDEARDLDCIYSLLSDPLVTGPLGMPVPSITIENLRLSKRDRTSREDATDWTIFFSENDTELFIGEIGIACWDVENHVVEVFIAIHPDHHGKAYGIEALSVLMDSIYARTQVALVRTQILESNTRSLSMVAKLGFRETGRRFVHPDPLRGFVGGTSVILDCRAHEFCKFSIHI